MDTEIAAFVVGWVFSICDMVLCLASIGGVDGILTIEYFLVVSRSVWIVLDCKIGVLREHPSKPRLSCPIDLHVFDVEALVHGLSGDVVLIWLHHGCIWLHVRSILQLVWTVSIAVRSPHGVQETNNSGWPQCIESELFAREVPRRAVDEVMLVILHRHERDTSRRFLKGLSNQNSDWPWHCSTKQPVYCEVDSVGIVEFSHVLVGDSLRSSSELTETHSDPWIRLEVIL